MCDVCDMVQSDQQIQEFFQSIILEKSQPKHDNYPFEDSVEKEAPIKRSIEQKDQPCNEEKNEPSASSFEI